MICFVFVAVLYLHFLFSYRTFSHTLIHTEPYIHTLSVLIALTYELVVASLCSVLHFYLADMALLFVVVGVIVVVHEQHRGNSSVKGVSYECSITREAGGGGGGTRHAH